MSDIGSRFPDVLEGAREGREPAWREIYAVFAPKVLGYLRSRAAADPEDLAGEVFLQIVRDLSKFRGDERDFRAWMFTIAHHRLLDDVRTRGRRPEILIPEPLPSDAVGDAEDEAVTAISERRILDLLSTLSEDQQAVLLLRLFGGLTVPQVAKILGKSGGAAKALQHRALRSLSRTIEEQDISFRLDDAMRGERA